MWITPGHRFIRVSANYFILGARILSTFFLKSFSNCSMYLKLKSVFILRIRSDCALVGRTAFHFLQRQAHLFASLDRTRCCPLRNRRKAARAMRSQRYAHKILQLYFYSVSSSKVTVLLCC